MNVFNRVVIVLAAIALIALVVYVAIAPLDAVYYARLGIDAFEQAIFEDQIFTILLGAYAALLVLLLILLWLEFRRRRKKTVKIRTDGNGEAQLGINSVAESLEYRIDELAGVRKVEPRITSRGRDVDVVINLDTSPSVNLPVLTDQVMQLCHDVLEGQLGLKIHSKVRLNVRHEPYPRGTMPSTKPLSSEPVSRPPQPIEMPISTGTPFQKPAAVKPEPVVKLADESEKSDS